MLVGPSALLEKARRLRKMLGGGMRQIGVLAAACLYALEHHRSRLAADHEHAARFAELARTGRGAAAPAPETNIVMVDLDRDAAPIVVALAEQGVLVSAFGPRRLRVVTHLDVGAADVERAARALVAVLGGGGAP